MTTRTWQEIIGGRRRDETLDKVTAAVRALPMLLASHRRLSYLRSVAQHCIELNEAQMPARYLVDLWPEVRGVRSQVQMNIGHIAELPYGERAILDTLVRLQAPRTLFEFGTFTGATTTLLADAAPQDATIHTLDLPAGAYGSNTGLAAMIGREFRDQPAHAGRIILHRGDSKTFDFTPFEGSVDFIYVDAGHRYDDVLRDSKNAFKMLARGGMIVWDDYQPSHLGVIQVLNRLSERVDLVRIAHSRLVIFRDQRG